MTPAPRGWPLALAGLALAVFAVVALSGPGRIDIEDGQTRFESGRSLVEHGDTALRDPRLYWFRLPGRNGLDHSNYRLPQELIAAGCVLLADVVGPVSEARRHFVFSLHGAVVAGGLAVAYAVWFRRRGLTPGAAVGWAAAGVFCTPSWYYATSTFDDILGTAVVVAAVAAADRGRAGGWGWVAAAAGCVGLAVNCKPPLAAILLPVVVFADDPARGRAARLGRAAVTAFGGAAGLAVYVGYERWKFPPEVAEAYARVMAANYGPVFRSDPVVGLLDYAVGPGAGLVWYCPPVVLGAAGLGAWWAGGRRREAAAVVAAAGVFVLFCSFLVFHKGGVCWGPRYLTPVAGLFWLFAPDGVAGVGRRAAGGLLAGGFGVQLLGLAIPPERLLVERDIPTGMYVVRPWLPFHPLAAHLPNRPREILDALTAPPAPEFTPGPAPTFTMPIMDPPFFPAPKGVEGVRRYTLLNTFRPWWATYPHLPPADRPADPLWAAAGFGGLLAAGLGLLAAGLAKPGAA